MSCQAAKSAVVPGRRMVGRAALAGALGVAALGVVPARAQSQAPDITVVANPAFRPTAVLLPHFAFTVATDSAAGGVVLRELTINPVTFTGWVRVDGIRPGARAAERRLFPDSVRFSQDGQVTLLVADSATRVPIEIEPRGVERAAAGKLVITARDWPNGRLFLVTIDPADLYEHRWRAVGYGVRDRITVDDSRHAVFLQDTTIANTVVAIAVGRGTQGAIRTEQTSIIVRTDYGGEVGRERRDLSRLVFVLQPSIGPDGRAHAELDFALGTSEQDAAGAAGATGGEPLGNVGGPRVTTPASDVDALLRHVLGAAAPMLRADRIAGYRFTPAGSYTFLAAFDRDGWYGASAALQLGDPDAVCSEYALMKRYADPSGAQRHEIWNRLGPQGVYLWTDDWGGRWMGDKDPYEILKGYACFRATRDAAWLARELPNLRKIARYILATDRNGNGLVEGMSSATYSEMSPLSPGDQPYRTEDPYVNALAAYALDRLAELEDAAGAAGDAVRWREAAARIRAALPELWRPHMEWFTYHAMADSAASWDHYHLQPVDALDFGAVRDTAIAATMVRRMMAGDWWDAENAGFYAVPHDDSWFDRAGYWTGWDWHILDFKAFEAVLRFGTTAERRGAWQRLSEEATRVLRVNYGRPGERGDNNGLFMFSAGSYLDLVARGLFGLDEHLDSVEIAPHVDGIADDFTWRLDGWRLTGDTVSLAYRPDQHLVTIAHGAARSVRFVLRFPWLRRGCAELRRPNVTEWYALEPRADGSSVLSIRGGGGASPDTITIAARACPRH